jgi:hypothetical protein
LTQPLKQMSIRNNYSGGGGCWRWPACGADNLTTFMCRLSWNLGASPSCLRSFIQPLALCLTTGPKPLPKQVLHIVRSTASSFRCEYPLLSLRSSSSFLHLLCLLPFTSIPPFIFPSVTCRRRQFLHKMWPIHLAFHYLFHVEYTSASWLQVIPLLFQDDRSNRSSPKAKWWNV